MKAETQALIDSMDSFKVQNFETPKGCYRLVFMLSKEGDIYLLKTKDGELCELTNLTQLAKVLVKEVPKDERTEP